MKITNTRVNAHGKPLEDTENTFGPETVIEGSLKWWRLQRKRKLPEGKKDGEPSKHGKP